MANQSPPADLVSSLILGLADDHLNDVLAALAENNQTEATTAARMLGDMLDILKDADRRRPAAPAEQQQPTPARPGKVRINITQRDRKGDIAEMTVFHIDEAVAPGGIVQQ